MLHSCEKGLELANEDEEEGDEFAYANCESCRFITAASRRALLLALLCCGAWDAEDR